MQVQRGYRGFTGSFGEEEGQTLFWALIEPDGMGRENEASEIKKQSVIIRVD